jgi:hypothetical protein
MGFFSSLGFGAFGFGTLIVVGLVCLCGAAAVALYGEELGIQTATNPPGPAILLEEYFEVQPAQGFPPEFQQQGSIEYAQGGYRISVDVPEWAVWGLAERSFTDTTIGVDATNLSAIQANEIGIICRYIDQNDFYYGFISSDGFYGIVRWFFGEYRLLSTGPAAANPAIRQGNGLNQVRLDCDGAAMRLWVNGTLLTQITGAEVRAGDTGLFVSAPLQGGVVILFDNFIVSEVVR